MSTEELKHAGGYRIQKCKLTSSSGLVFPDFEKAFSGHVCENSQNSQNPKTQTSDLAT